MAKKETATLQQKLGFFDEDLKKPKHDEIMLWLDSNIEDLVKQNFQVQAQPGQVEALKDQTINDIKLAIDWKLTMLEKLKAEALSIPTKAKELQERIDMEQKKVDYMLGWNGFDSNPKVVPEILRKIWEYTITTQGSYQNGNSSKFTVGFIDYAVTVKYPRYEPRVGGITYTWNQAYKKYENFDIVKVPYIYYQKEEMNLFFEVKTEIKSIGELIRQINHYRAYAFGIYTVVSPEQDETKINVLESQNIKHIRYMG
jgi:hypothetical protein